jgi:hypothetical protein
MTELRYAGTALAAAVLVLIASTAALGFWTADGSGTGSAQVATMGAPGTPDVPPAAVYNDVALSWTDATVPEPDDDARYGVQRRLQDATTWSDAGGNCPTLATPGAALDCTDKPATSGTYVYRVRVMWHSWTEDSPVGGPITVTVDTVAPTTTDDAPAGWTNEDVGVRLSAADNHGGSGVAETFYTTDGSEPTTASATYDGTPIVFTTEGVHTLRYISRDKAGNTEAVQSATIRIDKSFPTVAWTFPENGATYTEAQFLAGCSTPAAGDICGTAADTGGSELSEVEVSIRRESDNAYWNGSQFAVGVETFHTAIGTSTWSYALGSAKLTEGETYTIIARSLDHAANMSATATRRFTVSPPPPSCVEPTRTLSTSDLDTWIDQASPTASNGTSSDLFVASEQNKNRRALVRFNIGSLPAGCKVTSAELRLSASASSSGRTLQAYRAGATWAESSSPGWPGPALLGTAATAFSGSTVTWTTGIAPLVQAMYTSGNFGFAIKDQTEGSATKIEQKFQSREHSSTKPRLVIGFGPA